MPISTVGRCSCGVVLGGQASKIQGDPSDLTSSDTWKPIFPSEGVDKRSCGGGGGGDSGGGSGQRIRSALQIPGATGRANPIARNRSLR